MNFRLSSFGMAGLKRLGLSDRITALLNPEQSLPAVGQGALGIECRADRTDLVELMQPLHHQATAYCVEAERALSRVLGGSCQVPLGAFAEIINGTLELRGFVAQPDGKRIVSGDIKWQARNRYHFGTTTGLKANSRRCR